MTGRPPALDCGNCLHYRPDPEVMKYPSGGTGWCERLKRANRAPDPRRTNEANWCDQHARISHKPDSETQAA